MFFKLPILTSNNIVWVNLFPILFDETQHVVKTSTAGDVPVCYEIVNLFIKLQYFLVFFFIPTLKDLYLIVRTCDALLMIFLYFFITFLVSNFTKATALDFLDRMATSTEPSKLMKMSWGFFALPLVSQTPLSFKSNLRKV